MEKSEKIKSWIARGNPAMSVPVIAAVILFLVFLSGYLPLGNDLTLAAECIHGGGHGRVVPFVWSVLLKLSWWFVPGSDAFKLGFVSAASGIVAVAAYVYALGRLLPFASLFADRNAGQHDVGYGVLAKLGTLFAGLAMVLSVGIFHAATRIGPTTTELALAIVPFALASFCMDVERPLTRVYVLTLVGLFAGLAAWEGAPGIIALPFAFALVWLSPVRDDIRIANACGYFTIGVAVATLLVMGDGFDVPLLRLSFHAGFGQFLLLSFFPAAVLYRLITSRHVRARWSRFLFFGLWAAGIVLMVVLIVRDGTDGFGRAANEFVDGALAQLDGRKWIVCDGHLDDIVTFRKPADVHLVSFRRERDPVHGRQLARWAKDDLEGDDNLLFAAELGPTRFLNEWLSRKGAVTNCLFVTLMEPSLPIRHDAVLPGAYCWKPLGEGAKVDLSVAERDWRGAWDRLKPLLGPKEPGARLLRDWMSAQGNAIGTLYQEADRPEAAWKTYDYAVGEMSTGNLSLLLNLDEMARNGAVPNKAVGERAYGCLRSELSGIHREKVLRYRLSIGGRLYVSDATRAKLAKWKDEARLAAWKTPFGMRIKEALDRLHAAAAIKDKEARMKAIKSIETSIAPAIGASQGKEWVKHLFLGELARVKGGEALEKAQYHFRKVLSDGEGEVKLALDRLLAVDVALRDETAIEYDALLVLRFDIRHQYANALLGSVRLERGDCESAERFLRRAVTVGVPNPGIKNDLAFALSGLGRHREAEVMIEEAVRDCPGDWHLLDTMAEIYAASGQGEKSAEARRKSETSAQQCGQHRQYRDMVIARGKKQRKGWFW